MIGLNKIYNEDCLVGIKGIDDNSIDFVLTDPSYGIDFNSNSRVKSKLKNTKGILNDGKGNIDFLQSVAVELYRVLKDNTHLYWFTR